MLCRICIKDNKRIVVPMFQRGKRWKKTTGKEIYRFVNQRLSCGYYAFLWNFWRREKNIHFSRWSSTWKQYEKIYDQSNGIFYDDSISDKMCDDILRLVEKSGTENYSVIREIMTTFIKEQRTFKNLQFFDVAKNNRFFSAGYEPIVQSLKW